MPSREDGHLQWNGNCLWYEHHPFSCNNLLNQISGWGSTEAIERPVEQRQFVPGLGSNTEDIKENIDEGKLREAEVRNRLYGGA